MKVLAIIAALLLSVTSAFADYLVKDATGATITIKSFTCGSAVCPQMVLAGPTGVQVGTNGAPLFTTPATGASWPVTGTVGLTGTLPAFAATPTVNIGTAPTIAVTGPFLTDTQLRASALTINGTVSALQGGSWNTSPATATVTTPSITATSFTQVLGVNAARKGCTIWNNSVTQGYCSWAGSPTTSNSKLVPPYGGEFSCTPAGSPPVSNAISCTCAAGTCSFVVTQQ